MWNDQFRLSTVGIGACLNKLVSIILCILLFFYLTVSPCGFLDISCVFHKIDRNYRGILGKIFENNWLIEFTYPSKIILPKNRSFCVYVFFWDANEAFACS